MGMVGPNSLEDCRSAARSCGRVLAKAYRDLRVPDYEARARLLDTLRVKSYEWGEVESDRRAIVEAYIERIDEGLGYPFGWPGRDED
jgi:DNA-directed RNA polymerase subunit N (RpoN/RPB10)